MDQTVASTRVVLLHNFLTPYRIPLFTELARRMRLEVWILGNVKRIRDWPERPPENAFAWRDVPRFEVSLASRYNVLVLNPTLAQDLRQHRPDVLIQCGWDTPSAFYAAWHARRFRVPFVVWSGSTPAEQSLYRSVSRPLVRWLVRSADAWLAYGSRAQTYLQTLGADPARVFRAYNTVDLDFFAARARMSDEARGALRARYGLGDRRVVLYCGNLLDLKGVGELLAAFARLARQRKDVALLLVGSGNGEARYRAYCEAAGIQDRVVFAGFHAPEAIPPFYGLADLLVLPSRSEVWGLVINEAMACGVPVLTTEAVGASADLIQDGVNGYVVASKNPEALAEAMQRFFDGATDRRAMGEAARQAIQPFTVAHMADAFEAAIRCALHRRAPDRRDAGAPRAPG